MRHLLFTILLLIIFLKAWTQDAKIEKLQRQLAHHTQQDSFRVNRLNELALLPLSPHRRDSIANEAIFISKKIKYPKGEGFALVNLALAKRQKGERAPAFLLLQQAEAIAKTTADDVLLVNVLLGMSNVKSQTAENRLALEYLLRAESLAQKTGDKKLIARCQRTISSWYQTSSNDFARGMEWILKSIKTSEEANCLECLALSWGSLASLYTSLGDNEQALVYYKKAFEANNLLGNKNMQIDLLSRIGERYRLMGNYPEAIKAYKASLHDETLPYGIELIESNLADVYVRMDSLPLAFSYAFKSLHGAKQIGDDEGVAWIDGILARAYLKKGMPDSAIYYARSGFDIAIKTGSVEFTRDNAAALADAYALKKDFANAYPYHLQYIQYRDSMLNTEVKNKTTLLQYNSDLNKKQAQISQLHQQKKAQQNFLIGALVMLLLIVITAIVLLRSMRHKQKANILLLKQKQEIENQRDQINKALANLKSTQSQLIQSEKMASLGELTAGIAHEIQNPLNFVNNFSEVSNELIEELKIKNEKLKIEDEEVNSLLTDLSQNLEKINHHGKRADAIVKGMLQHSRASSNKKEPTDINALADEYLRLSYHGLRAKDKSFNAKFETHFDQSIGKIDIVPQDIGRVILNLINNAFYAVSEKKTLRQAQGDNSYEPTVTVSTSHSLSIGEGRGEVQIKVKDNGNGIPQKVLDKIFQPFFTTKPTGQGTGLGLSLSYDIVKAHGGEIKVETKDGEGTVFMIQIPLHSS